MIFAETKFRLFGDKDFSVNRCGQSYPGTGVNSCVQDGINILDSKIFTRLLSD
jgi:hypothetical protein